MTESAGYVDFWGLRNRAASMAARAVEDGLGVRDANTALDEVKAANVAQQGATEALLVAVTNARDNGSSWTDIGRALGLTKQGARQRFADLSDEEALIYSIYATRQAGEVIHVPKPMAVLLPAFSWIRQGIDEGRYGEASFYVDGREAFIKVDVSDYLIHHPSVAASLLVTDEFRDPLSKGRVLLARRSVQASDMMDNLTVGSRVIASGEWCRVIGFTDSDIQLLPDNRDLPNALSA
jgi:hypothetical protein